MEKPLPVERLFHDTMIEPDATTDYRLPIGGGPVYIHFQAVFAGAGFGAVFGFLLSVWNRRRAACGEICRLNGDPRVATVAYAMIGAFLGGTFEF